jgi:REP element-mobilizing transposase RayT
MVTVHLTARMLPWRLSLLDTAPWLWEWLKDAFPDALAVCLMPRHLHLLVDVPDPARAVTKLRLLLRWHARLQVDVAADRVWAPLDHAEPIRGWEELSRQVRYVALLPCSAGYATDPLEWPWSTHRDVMGAVVGPWIDALRLAQALGRLDWGFAEAHHAYVSAAGGGGRLGSPPPLRLKSDELLMPALSDLALASLRATRSELESLSRRGASRALFLNLAYAFGWTDPRDLGRVCDLTDAGVRRVLGHGVPGRWMKAGELCMGDLRLLRGPTAERAREVI